MSLVLVLSGQGPLKEKIEAQVIKMGLDERVLFVDTKNFSDVEILSITDLLVMPALHEMNVTPLIQAQILGVPALVSDVISRDVDLSSDFIHFLPLGEDLSLWMRALDNILKKKMPKTDKAYDAALESPYNIERNIETLKGLYQETLFKNYEKTNS